MPEERSRKIRHTLIGVLVLNWLVAAAKIIFGYYTNSNSMAADGFHSFSDGGSNIVGLVGIWVAAQPVDREHPYGHKKYETFYSLGIAILLFIVCFNIFHDGIARLKMPVIPQVNIYSFIVMFVTTAVNFFVMAYEYRTGKRLNSDILVSDSLHTRADILTSFSVILALLAVKIGFPVMDAAGSLLIGGFIAYSAFGILRQSSKVLCDTAVIDTREIERVVKGIAGVEACHKIRTRGRCDDIFIDLHVLVRNDMHMDRAHELSYRIENAIKKQFSGVSDVVVHLEPLDRRRRGQERLNGNGS